MLGPERALGGRLLDLVGAQGADAVDLAHHRGVDPGDRAGVGHAVGGGDLGGPDGPRVEDADVGERPARALSALPRLVSGPVNWSIMALRASSVGASITMSGATRWSSSSGRPMYQSAPSGPGDLVVEEGAEALAADALDDLTDEPAVGRGVVAGGGAGLPLGGLGGQALDDGLPGQGLVEGHGAVDPRQAGLVRQEVADRHVLLAGRGELGPVGGDRRLDVELAPLGQPVGAQRGGALGRREHQDHGVLLPGRARSPASATPPHRSTTFWPRW